MVITDTQMPGINGLEAVAPISRKLRHAVQSTLAAGTYFNARVTRMLQVSM